MNKTLPAKRLRLLMVEDDETRVAIIRNWLPPDVHLVWAQSAGSALGILARDGQGIYAGVLLDHDLFMRPRAEDDKHHCGTDIVDLMLEELDRDAAILVHSMNPGAAADMVRRLGSAGFAVTRIPMKEMTKMAFTDWLSEVRQDWEG